jgi:Protein of unknown function (DUF3135)
MYQFDFDEWSTLAKTDPVEFERKRKEVIDSVIMTALLEMRYNLRLAQITCDALRTEIDDPLLASAAMLGLAQNTLKKLEPAFTQLLATIDKSKEPE